MNDFHFYIYQSGFEVSNGTECGARKVDNSVFYKRPPVDNSYFDTFVIFHIGHFDHCAKRQGSVGCSVGKLI